MQSLCTLRDHCRQGSRNTRYQAGAAPYLDRSSTGWIAPACLAHSFDHLVGSREQRRRHSHASTSAVLRLMTSSIFVTAASAGRHALRLCGASSGAKENITISGATLSPFALISLTPTVIRWGNRPSSLWIAEEFWCCASG